VAGPLEGIAVVELAQMIAVPGATFQLAAQGATVIKVENTEGGDDLRAYGSGKGGISGWFANANAGKRSIGLDLQTEPGREVLWKLLEDADVFIQGFRPGAVDRLGFDWEAVHSQNPNLVYVSSSGFGATGPYSDRPVFDPVIQALSGWAGAQTTDEGPTLIRGMVADKVAALTAAQAVCAALVGRGRTGVGEHIELSMLEANVAFNWPDVMMHCTVLDDDATHLPNLLAHYQLFPSADGWVSVTAGNDKQWQGVCDALDRPDLAADDRYASAASRGANFKDWYGAFGEMCRAFPTDELLARCQAADIPAVAALDPADVMNDQQVVARGAVREVDHPVIGRIRMPRQGATFASSGEPELGPAPLHAQHTDEILGELGYDDEVIARLRGAKNVK